MTQPSDWQVHPPQQITKTRVGPEDVHLRVGPDERELE